MAEDKILLATHKKGISDKAHDGKNIGTEMGADADGDINSVGDTLLVTSNAIETKLLARNTAQDDAKQLTGELNDLEDDWDKDYKAAADKAMEIYPDAGPTWTGYGFDLADVEPSDRPAPPKVTGLQVTQGDEIGEGDLVWDPQAQHANDGFFIEVNPSDPIDPTGWVSASPRSVSASKVSITGLTTGQKYWVRVIAYLTKGDEGPPSDPKSLIAP